MNPTIRAHNLADLMEELIALLDRETAMLERPRAHDLQKVVEEKQALFKLYDDHLSAIAGEPGFAEALDDEMNDRLKDLAQRLETAIGTNRRKLEILTRSSQHIVNRIVEAAKNAAGRVSNYGRGGSVVTDGRAAAPVAMNQEI
jgi:flagellar biosynthesis/type III secretory pathway chaperone